MLELKPKKSKFSFDWLLRGVLTKVGETFDRLTGRNWKPSSSLATSELIERLKLLLDAEMKNSEGAGRFVPHNIKLKMQWDKFSTDLEKSVEKLRNELHIAAIDHINDKRYYTYAPIDVEIVPDYFTEGVKILASFDKFDEDQREAEVNVTLPDLKVAALIPAAEETVSISSCTFVVSFEHGGKQISRELTFRAGDRKSIGRTKENEIVIDDPSISKIHAALVLNSNDQLVLADTGSTNGTFINDSRISYGRAYGVNDGDVLKFGTVLVGLEYLVREEAIAEQIEQVSANEMDINDSDRAIEPVDSASLGLSQVFGVETDVASDSLDFSDLIDEIPVETDSTKPGILLNLEENEPGQ